MLIQIEPDAASLPGTTECSGCHEGGAWLQGVSPEALNPEGLFWAIYHCRLCDNRFSVAVDPGWIDSVLTVRQRNKTVPAEAFKEGWDDPNLVVRFKPLHHDGRDPLRPFLSLMRDGTASCPADIGWPVNLGPLTAQDLIRLAWRLEPLAEQLGKYESYAFRFRTAEGRIRERLVGFDWEMGVILGYEPAEVELVSEVLRHYQALSYEAGLRPGLTFKRDVTLLMPGAPAAAPSRDPAAVAGVSREDGPPQAPSGPGTGADDQAISQIIMTLARVQDGHWQHFRAANFLLASEEDAARYALRSWAPRILQAPYLADGGFWQQLDFWLERSALERCLAHTKAFRSTDALALLIPDDSAAETIVDAMLDLHESAAAGAMPLWDPFTLAAIWTLDHAAEATASQLLPRIEPARWIERLELSRLRHKLGLSMEPSPLSSLRPTWVRDHHPAIGRDPLGGALTKAALSADPYAVTESQWASPLPGTWAIMGDLDHLKQVNDCQGLLGGDLAIWGTIQTLQEAVGDRVIRFGGEAFLILTDEEDGPRLAESLRQTIEETRHAPVGHLEGPLSVTISLSVACAGETEPTLRKLEEGMDRAKCGGRNRVVVMD